MYKYTHVYTFNVKMSAGSIRVKLFLSKKIHKDLLKCYVLLNAWDNPSLKIHKILLFHNDLTTISFFSIPGIGRRILTTAFISSLSENDAQSYSSHLNLLPFIQIKMPGCPAGMFVPMDHTYRQVLGD